ncbi:hypothetical protein [Riemerella anatipestifer]|uniref:hypothetical protein n=1 Tax=Riemerella anatipestifer TaxID=34085 RepID=UPI00129D7F22|nr:hypothetical protein [Riemerella anatipestifer]
MKNILLVLALLSNVIVKSQVTTVIDGFSTHLTKSDLPFSGDRKLFAIGFNDRLTNNYIVVSKNKAGAENDLLYIEKFEKKQENVFEKVFSTKLEHPVNKSLAFVNNRMMYSDIDKDGYAEFIYIVDQYKNGMNSPLERVWGIVVYKNKAYKMWTTVESQFSDTVFDDDFKTLPEKVKTEFLDFWNQLNKHK